MQIFGCVGTPYLIRIFLYILRWRSHYLYKVGACSWLSSLRHKIFRLYFTVFQLNQLISSVVNFTGFLIYGIWKKIQEAELFVLRIIFLFGKKVILLLLLGLLLKLLKVLRLLKFLIFMRYRRTWRPGRPRRFKTLLI